MHRRSRPVSVVAVAVAVLAVLTNGCSDASAAKCVRSGQAKICYARDNAASGSLDVSGLQPGSTLTVASQATGETTYRINSAGTLDGKVGFINGTGAPTRVTVTGTTRAGEILAGTFAT